MIDHWLKSQNSSTITKTLVAYAILGKHEAIESILDAMLRQTSVADLDMRDRFGTFSTDEPSSQGMPEVEE